ncbi:rifin [Plasmodium reichenowi]|uniref:Rifin n=1 Tax=Plasmodium reichenowi TaxID=5854 RepID=A0A060RM13_PLARE|nr:rifin [Plasmodium reichenowi]
MKVHYINILLFVLTLNILLTSYHAHNKNKPSITPHHTPTTTSRVLSECDTESSIYDNDEEINSVKENFERQTSQRFEEYQERMKEKRKGCLMCGCGLGSVAGSVGLFGGIIINIWKPGALKAAIAEALEANHAMISAAGVKAGEAAGAAKVVAGLKQMGILTLDNQPLGSYITPNTYTNVTNITQVVNKQYFETCADYSSGKAVYLFGDAKRNIPICQSVWEQTQAVSKTKKGISEMEGIKTAVETMVSNAKEVASDASAAKSAELTAKITEQQTNVINTIFMSKQTAIIASIIAIIIIVLIMVIIYLILRYRRKKKMKKKAQYTKLLNE